MNIQSQCIFYVNSSHTKTNTNTDTHTLIHMQTSKHFSSGFPAYTIVLPSLSLIQPAFFIRFITLNLLFLCILHYIPHKNLLCIQFFFLIMQLKTFKTSQHAALLTTPSLRHLFSTVFLTLSLYALHCSWLQRRLAVYLINRMAYQHILRSI